MPLLAALAFTSAASYSFRSLGVSISQYIGQFLAVAGESIYAMLGPIWRLLHFGDQGRRPLPERFILE